MTKFAARLDCIILLFDSLKIEAYSPSGCVATLICEWPSLFLFFVLVGYSLCKKIFNQNTESVQVYCIVWHTHIRVLYLTHNL